MPGITIVQRPELVRKRPHQVTLYLDKTPQGNLPTFRRNKRPVYRLKVDDVVHEDGRVTRVWVHGLEFSATELFQQIKAHMPLKCRLLVPYRARLLRRRPH